MRARRRCTLSVLIKYSPSWTSRRAARLAMPSSASSRKDRKKEYKGSPALDAGLLAAAQAVEHYEISLTWAQELGLEEAVELLDTTLAEEKKTDELLTEIAESSVN